MQTYKVFFGHQDSIGVEVEAASEKDAKIKAMTVLRDNRGERSWNPSQCVDWESGKSINKPPMTRDFGYFPPIIRVDEIESTKNNLI